jgi:hypothetical protein
MFFNSYNSIVIAISYPPFTLEIISYAFSGILFVYVAEPSESPTATGEQYVSPIEKHGYCAT